MLVIFSELNETPSFPINSPKPLPKCFMASPRPQALFSILPPSLSGSAFTASAIVLIEFVTFVIKLESKLVPFILLTKLLIPLAKWSIATPRPHPLFSIFPPSLSGRLLNTSDNVLTPLTAEFIVSILKLHPFNFSKKHLNPLAIWPIPSPKPLALFSSSLPFTSGNAPAASANVFTALTTSVVFSILTSFTSLQKSLIPVPKVFNSLPNTATDCLPVNHWAIPWRFGRILVNSANPFAALVALPIFSTLISLISSPKSLIPVPKALSSPPNNSSDCLPVNHWAIPALLGTLWVNCINLSAASIALLILEESKSLTSLEKDLTPFPNASNSPPNNSSDCLPVNHWAIPALLGTLLHRSINTSAALVA